MMVCIEPDKVASLYFRRDVSLLYVSTSDGGMFAYRNVLEERVQASLYR